MSGIKYGLENELGIRWTGSGLALAALTAGALLVLGCLRREAAPRRTASGEMWVRVLNYTLNIDS
jgi:hypothetical protein